MFLSARLIAVELIWIGILLSTWVCGSGHECKIEDYLNALSFLRLGALFLTLGLMFNSMFPEAVNLFIYIRMFMHILGGIFMLSGLISFYWIKIDPRFAFLYAFGSSALILTFINYYLPF